MNRYTNARLKAYPAKTVMQVATRDIFPVSSDARANRPYGVSPPGKAKNPERSMAESKRRAIAHARDIALCNHFQFMITWTLDGTLIDRYDPVAVYRKTRYYLSNAVQRKGFQYILVPEYHIRKGNELTPAIHMHGLCILGDVPIVRAFSPSGRPLTDKHGRPIYNMPSWNWGFSTCVPLDEQYERAANYVVKYINKSNEKIFGKWTISSRGLIKSPEIIPLAPVDYIDFRDPVKLKVHEQNEAEIYPGLSIVSEEYPALEQGMAVE